MKAYRFASSADLMALFQAQLDRFPRVQQNGESRRVFSEFGGLMIRPNKEPQNRLTNIVFPETILAIPGAGRSLRSHTDQTFPQAGLMADIRSNALLAKVAADHLTGDSLTERVALILTTDDVFFNADLWDYFSSEDRQRLVQSGFGPDMSIEQWVQAIDNFGLPVLCVVLLGGFTTNFLWCAYLAPSAPIKANADLTCSVSRWIKAAPCAVSRAVL
jgi:hypothetical protein